MAAPSLAYEPPELRYDSKQLRLKEQYDNDPRLIQKRKACETRLDALNLQIPQHVKLSDQNVGNLFALGIEESHHAARFPLDFMCIRKKPPYYVILPNRVNAGPPALQEDGKVIVIGDHALVGGGKDKVDFKLLGWNHISTPRVIQSPYTWQRQQAFKAEYKDCFRRSNLQHAEKKKKEAVLQARKRKMQVLLEAGRERKEAHAAIQQAQRKENEKQSDIFPLTEGALTRYIDAAAGLGPPYVRGFDDKKELMDMYDEEIHRAVSHITFHTSILLSYLQNTHDAAYAHTTRKRMLATFDQTWNRIDNNAAGRRGPFAFMTPMPQALFKVYIDLTNSVREGDRKEQEEERKAMAKALKLREENREQIRMLMDMQDDVIDRLCVFVGEGEERQVQRRQTPFVKEEEVKEVTLNKGKKSENGMEDEDAVVQVKPEGRKQEEQKQPAQKEKHLTRKNKYRKRRK